MAWFRRKKRAAHDDSSDPPWARAAQALPEQIFVSSLGIAKTAAGVSDSEQFMRQFLNPETSERALSLQSEAMYALLHIADRVSFNVLDPDYRFLFNELLQRGTFSWSAKFYAECGLPEGEKEAFSKHLRDAFNDATQQYAECDEIVKDEARHGLQGTVVRKLSERFAQSGVSGFGNPFEEAKVAIRLAGEIKRLDIANRLTA